MSQGKIASITTTNRKGVVLQFVSEVDSYPLALSKPCVGLSIANLDASDLTFTLTYQTGATITGTVPANYTYDATFEPFESIDIAGTSFLGEVRR